MSKDCVFRNKRIGNIELRNLADNAYYKAEIVQWCPNPYYSKENEYIYDETHKLYHKKGSRNCFIGASVFKNREYCCTIAWVILNSCRDEFDVKSVGTRAFDLKEKDRTAFMKILKYVSETIKKHHIIK